MPPHDESLSQYLLALEHEVLIVVATNQDLGAAMDLLCRRVEEIVPDVTTSILAVDDEGRLRPLAGPSVPEVFSRSIDGIPIGPNIGSCGTAAYKREPVECHDLETDPLWRNFKEIPLQHGLKACWSSPILAKDGRAVGSFAFYYREKRGPSAIDLQIVESCIHLCTIAIEHDRAREQIRRIAYVDPITGLPNRSAFQSRGVAILAEAKETGRTLAVHYLDLDDFKGVNDTLGHRVGDMALHQIGERLLEVAGKEALITRLGGDEFAILQPDARPVDAERLSGAVLASFETDFVVEGHVISLGASCGIARAPDDGVTLIELMKNADLALYRAKADGRGRCRFFLPEMADAVRRRREREADLRRAIENDELALVYQPIVDLQTGRITSCETLLRWNHPTRGLVPPTEFVPMAEDIGLIPVIGRWVLKRACAEATRWPETVSVAINLSAVQLRNPSFSTEVRRTLADVGLDPHRLILEITESVILAENRQTKAVLSELRRAGVRLALDDFGTGYSSLRSLRVFPIDTIKIDRSFVAELGRTPHAMTIVTAVIVLARELGMKTTAEGIETAGQMDWLTEAGCTEGQGYLLARPKAAAEVRQFLAAECALAAPEEPRRLAAG
ncbi:putative bifunctional diguanylate cyclase/phosphodiesterase [Bauldia litoralis]|uniref:Diguanylate cyclase (GGDEF) domain-containing protein n=1 Tax=Bauldia litoralis TaxID=665467 RepID=A0A1G6ASN9_9HYPH|nr:EAL domain-containing protein [Bauldia litoralis]SDB11415.1 diguanylate cyclase (GGDEF) domain-containing protein [Bauldia litoralis]